MSDLTTQGATDAAAGLLTLYTSGTARVGVGDGSTAFNIAQTALTGTNTQYNAVTSASRVSARLTYEAVFTAGQANFTWREIAVDRTTSLMVRKVLSNPLTKASGEEWTVQVNIDFTPG